jgi:hypothetical protein
VDTVPVPVTDVPADTPLSTAAKSGEAALPQDQQQLLRGLNNLCGEIHHKLGVLETDYMTAKNALLSEFSRNRQVYQETVEKAAKALGIDSKNETWTFEASTMTLRRTK